MSKAEQILKLYAEGHTTRVIAGIVYGLDDDKTPQSEWAKRVTYCRVVARQRKGTGQSEYDRRYCQSEDYKKRKREQFRRKYRADPAFRLKKLECVRAYRARKRAEANQLA